MLIIFGGLPGTGKSSVATALAAALAAVYLRIDTIEQALRSCGTLPAVVTEGYIVAYRLAEENLRLGHIVVADSVNPIGVTRDSWLAVATSAGVPAVEVEVICSDRDKHRHRVETRATDIPGLRLPSWQDVLGREYHPWDRPHIVIDTASQTIQDSVAGLIAQLPNHAAHPLRTPAPHPPPIAGPIGGPT